MSENTLNNHSDLVWKIAELLRGTYRPPQYRRVMIPLTVLRRLDCVLDATREQVRAELAKPIYQAMPRAKVEETINKKLGIPFHNSSDFSFKKLLNDADKLETNLNKFISSFSGTARRILEKFEFDKEITKMEDANRLYEVVNEIGNGQGNKPDHIAEITRIYNDCQDDDSRVLVAGDKPVKVSKVFRNQEFAYLKLTVERPLRLNFRVDEARLQRFNEGSYFIGLPLSGKRVDLKGRQADIAAGKKRQAEILSVLVGMKAAFADGQLVLDRVEFSKQLKAAFTKAEVKTDAALLKALLLPSALGERDPQAKPCIASLGGFEPDPELRDTEQVPLPAAIALPLPIGYDEKDSKAKLIALVREHCNAYLKREVLPYRADAWIDFEKIKVGYEIPFTRHFYEYQPPRPLAVIAQEVKDLEAEIARMLEGVV